MTLVFFLLVAVVSGAIGFAAGFYIGARETLAYAREEGLVDERRDCSPD